MILSCVLLVVHLLTSANNKQLEFKIAIIMILSSLSCLFGEYQMKNDSLKNIKEAIQDQYSDARIIEDQRYSGTFLTQGKEYSYSVKDSVIRWQKRYNKLIVRDCSFAEYYIHDFHLNKHKITCKKTYKDYRAVGIDTSGVCSFA